MKQLRKALALTIASIFVLSLSAQDKKVKVSILGDSYSTFEGFVEDGDELWYGSSP